MCALNTSLSTPTITVCTLEMTNLVTTWASQRQVAPVAHFCKKPRGCAGLSLDTLKLEEDSALVSFTIVPTSCVVLMSHDVSMSCRYMYEDRA